MGYELKKVRVRASRRALAHAVKEVRAGGVRGYYGDIVPDPSRAAGAEEGETLEWARRRVLDVVKDTRMQLLLQMRDPNRVAVAWSLR